MQNLYEGTIKVKMCANHQESFYQNNTYQKQAVLRKRLMLYARRDAAPGSFSMFSARTLTNKAVRQIRLDVMEPPSPFIPPFTPPDENVCLNSLLIRARAGIFYLNGFPTYSNIFGAFVLAEGTLCDWSLTSKPVCLTDCLSVCSIKANYCEHTQSSVNTPGVRSSR